MGARGMGAIGNLALGSVAADVIERATVPVTLLREVPVPERSYRKVLIPLDGSASSGRAAAFMARRARAIADLQLLAINVQEPVEHWHRAAAEVDATLRHRRDHGEALCRSACEVLSRAAGKFEFEVRFGDPAPVISETASGEGCDLIVMGTRGLVSLGGLILGSVAFKTLHAANVPIMLIK
jgi:nucleotide-binding universal stress UspA family protein